MHSHLVLADYLVWGINILGRIAVIAVLLRSNLHRRFPLFLSFLCYCSLRDTGLFFICEYARYKAYFYCYWYSLILSYILNVCACYEIGRDVLDPVWLLPKRIGWVFATVSVCAAVILFHISPHGYMTRAVTMVLRKTEWSITCAECVAFILLATVRKLYAISYKEVSISLAEGFVMSALLDMLLQTIHLIPQAINSSMIARMRDYTGLAACIWWIISFYPYSAARQQESLQPEDTAIKGLS